MVICNCNALFVLKWFFPLQTFVNDLRIPEQTYITLKLSDVIRFGYDILSSASCLCYVDVNQSIYPFRVPLSLLFHFLLNCFSAC